MPPEPDGLVVQRSEGGRVGGDVPVAKLLEAGLQRGQRGAQLMGDVG